MSDDKKYFVIRSSNRQTGKKEHFSVKYCSVNEKEDLGSLPAAAIFPISQRYDEDLQEKRAEDYSKYVNKLDEAAKIAYDQIHLVDVLKR
jgi:hypothetical protein